MSDERLTEIRDLLQQLLEQARESARRYDEAERKHAAAVQNQQRAIAEWRRGARVVLCAVVVLVGVLVWLVAR